MHCNTNKLCKKRNFVATVLNVFDLLKKNKNLNENEQIIQQTKENLSIDTIQKVIHKIDQAKYIDIIANN